jgi:hypothetical protein
MLRKCLLAFVMAYSLAACARAPIPDDEPSSDWSRDPGRGDAQVRDDASSESARDASFDARVQRDAARQDDRDARASDVPDAAQIPDAALRDASSPRDAQARDANIADANAPTSDAGGREDASAGGTCDLAPCMDHCPLATPCCTSLDTCACQLGAGPCILPPLP